MVNVTKAAFAEP